MKRQLSKKTFWQSILSSIVLGFMILLAAGSTSDKKVIKEDLGNGYIKVTTTYGGAENTVETVTGKGDEYIRYHGLVIRESKSDSYWSREEVNYRNGVRSGMTTFTDSKGVTKYTCYVGGVAEPCYKAEHLITADASAFQVLGAKHPWFIDKLYVFGYDKDNVEAYMDALETILENFGDEPMKFDSYYEDAVDSLTETPYDSIIQLNTMLSNDQGEEEAKNDEFRMAVIDRYRSDGKTTYNIVNSIYPGYLKSIIELGIIDQDFEGFCMATDSIMTADEALYGSLDLEGPFFVDSVDLRLFRAIFSMMETEENTSSELKSMKRRALFYGKNEFRDLYSEINSLVLHTVSDSTNQAAAAAVLYFIILKFEQGDLFKYAVKEAWLSKNAVVRVPRVVTEFSGNHSATSVSLQGEVLEDGGADVTTRGIAWATFYNPTTDDHSETSGTGLGTFEITLSNLIEGTTYYARTYGINSAGTAYGNCLKFTAGGAVGINDEKISAPVLKVYPNPASSLTTFSFNIESSGNIALTIINIKGQAVYHHDLGSLPQGENQIGLDLSYLQNGLYNCRLISNGKIQSTQKLLIAQ